MPTPSQRPQSKRSTSNNSPAYFLAHTRTRANQPLLLPLTFCFFNVKPSSSASPRHFHFTQPTVKRWVLHSIHSTNWPALGSAIFLQPSPTYLQRGIGRYSRNHFPSVGFCIPGHSTNWPALSSVIIFREANPIYPQGGIGRFTVSITLPNAWSAHPLRAGRSLSNPLSTTSLAIFCRSCCSSGITNHGQESCVPYPWLRENVSLESLGSHVLGPFQKIPPHAGCCSDSQAAGSTRKVRGMQFISTSPNNRPQSALL